MSGAADNYEVRLSQALNGGFATICRC